MKQFEKGRSMIEMLGVLAIIGVLSVGGLSGYTMAMNRHRANQILDYVTRAAVLAQTHGTGSTPLTDENCTAYNGSETAPSSMTGCKVTTSLTTDRVLVTTTVSNEKVREALTSRSSEAACINAASSAVSIVLNCTGCTTNNCPTTLSVPAGNGTGTGTGTGTGG